MRTPTMRRKAADALEQGREAATRVGKVAKAAAVAGAKAGATAAVAAGTLEAQRTWKATKPANQRKALKNAAIAVAAGAAVVGAGVAIARSRLGRTK